MAIVLRHTQKALVAALTAAWLTVPNVLAVSPTGSGKTVVFAKVVADEPGASCVIAHRHELVGQISMALARNGVRHRIIGSDDLRRECTAGHMDELRINYVDANSKVAVASVQTLVRRDGVNDAWFASVKLWVMDEAHHLLRENMWGKAIAMFPNARGLGVTAETERADGCGLGAWNDGVFHQLVEAPGMRAHIGLGFLTDYRVFVPPSDLDLTGVDTTGSGDFSPAKLSAATAKSHVTGDIVTHYLRIAPGKLGITFAVDINAAKDIAAAYRAAGVPAEVVTSKTPAALRRSILRKFRKREILQLVNVDLFGEGFDLPAIEVVSMGRATASYQLYKQQFGRVLRLMDGKLWGIVIDHVGNVMRHGLPDKPRKQSLERRERRSKSKVDEDLIPMTVCVECSSPYERIYKACPFCGHCVEPASRSAPEFVDGDLCELTADVLAKMRGDIDKPPNTYGLEPYIAAGVMNRFAEKCAQQEELRATIALWAGWHRSNGRQDSEIYRLFYLTYGTDVLSAQVLPRKDAEALNLLLRTRLDEVGVVAT